MSQFVLCLLVFFTPLSARPQHHHPAGDRPSVHGMLFFGKKKIYLSHLPMFHSPHDYQAILEAEVDPATLASYSLAREENPEETVYTLEPERFVLPEMVAHPHAFRAKLYSGHFERGGKIIAGNVRVMITKVIYFRKLSPRAPLGESFLLFGAEDALFMAHKIGGRGDFDQVLELPVTLEKLKRLGGLPFVPVDDIHPSEGRSYYYETGDLSQ